jgi:hypothetical protein
MLFLNFSFVLLVSDIFFAKLSIFCTILFPQEIFCINVSFASLREAAEIEGKDKKKIYKRGIITYSFFIIICLMS